MQLKIKNNFFTLDSSGALFWEAERTLFIADLHLGKVEHFRANGSPIPTNATVKNYEKLNRVVQQYKPKQLVFLGDLFHTTLNQSWRTFETWVKNQSFSILLVVGNHDIIPEEAFMKLGIHLCMTWEKDFLFGTHHPAEKKGKINVCGHIHPGYLLRGAGKQYLKLACFYQKKNQLILPAFGGFTGKYLIQPEDGEHIFVIGEHNVFEIPLK